MGKRYKTVAEFQKEGATLEIVSLGGRMVYEVDGPQSCTWLAPDQLGTVVPSHMPFNAKTMVLFELEAVV